MAACSKARASGFDPSNPLHCATQFELYSIIARHQGNQKSASGYGARSQWYADRARALPENERTPAVIAELGNRIAASPDGGLALATACKNRQDADPGFQRLVQQAKAAATR